MNYELIVNQIKDGGLPHFVGIGLSQTQVNEIRSLLELRKKDYCSKIDEYFNTCVATRLIKSHSMSEKREEL